MNRAEKRRQKKLDLKTKKSEVGKDNIKSDLKSNKLISMRERWLGIRDSLAALEQQIIDRLERVQGGVPTFHDNYQLEMIAKLDNLFSPTPIGDYEISTEAFNQIETVLNRLQAKVSKNLQGQMVATDERHAFAEMVEAREVYLPPYGDEVDSYTMNMSQGVEQCMHWKGLPIFKTVFDFSLYSMLIWDVQPKTIIEIGSGTGASAIWMADLVESYKLETQIYSLDVEKPNLEYKHVSFIQGDCNAIERDFSSELLAELPHPWIVIEDAHVNVLNVVGHFSAHMLPRDYIIVEDSRGPKESDILKWSNLNKDKFKIDTKYTDFFGRNATCSPDSIFAAVA